MSAPRRIRSVLSAAALAGAWACGGEPSGAAPATGAPRRPASPPLTAEHASEAAAQRWPADPCAWLPVVAVESIVGPLAGAPRRSEGGCLFPLPPDADAGRRREMAQRLEAAAAEMARRSGQSYTPMEDRRPSEPAVIVEVRVDDETAGERGLGAAEAVTARWIGERPETTGRARDARAAGWDFARSPIAPGLAGFLGRVGQLSVSVLLQATRLPTATVTALAARVRDGIPDRPFAPSDGAGSAAGADRTDPDPCTLLTRAEVEAVLGPLTLPPYRTGETSPYPDPQGQRCAYRTAGHRVLGLTPRWTGGRADMATVRGVGGLVTAVMPGASPEAADTIEGPWEEAMTDPTIGSLLFRSGDRSFEIAYATSSTDAAGAARLARQAAGRFFTPGGR